jgi:hypothetical protein
VRASASGFPDADARINRNLAAGARFVPIWWPAPAHRHGRDDQQRRPEGSMPVDLLFLGYPVIDQV